MRLRGGTGGMMSEQLIDGEVVVVGVFTEKPREGIPSAEPVDLAFFLTTDEGVFEMDGVREPYLIDWLDWKVMRGPEGLERQVTYRADDGMSCAIERDILPADLPDTVYAMMGRIMLTEFGGD